jgi:2-polyprenyl-3-methyl-5-hydroxy-6-metoxy-1,4-benzoquinol methylase
MRQNIEVYGWDHQIPPSYYYLSPLILKLVKQYQPSYLLDIGCGNGALCHLLTQHHFSAFGIDADQQAIQIAKQQYPKTTFFQYSLQQNPQLLLNQLGHLVEMVIATEVIEHLYSPQLLLNFAATCLMPNGQLIISTPYHGYLKNLALSLSNHWDQHHTALWEGGHIKFFSQNTITALLNQHNFRVKKIYGVGRFPYFWKSMVVVAEKIKTRN